MFGWIYMILAILLEVAGTTCMKFSAGFTKVWPSIFIFVFYALCFSILTLALKTIEVSIAYAIWSGLGTVLMVSIGILWFQESVNLIKILSMVLIIIGVVGLHLSHEPVSEQEGILSTVGASLDQLETTQLINSDIAPANVNVNSITKSNNIEKPLINTP